MREVLQNYIDGCVAAGAAVEPIREARGGVRLTNPGLLTRRDLLVGVSSKPGKENQIGKFGEGLKLGALALVRSGSSVTVRSGGEEFAARVAASPDYGGAEVLAWDVRPVDMPDPDVVDVVVSGPAAASTEAVTSRFRALHAPVRPIYTIGRDHLLAGPPGRLYVRGVYVQDVDLPWSVDLGDVQIDRDRRMVGGQGVQWAASWLVGLAVANGHVPAVALIEHAANPLLRSVDSVCGPTMGYGGMIAQRLAPVWRARYGDAVAVGSAEEQARARGDGIAAVVVETEWLRSLLDVAVGSLANRLRDRAQTVVRVVPVTDLTEAEARVWRWCLAEVERAAGVVGMSRCPAQVVEYAAGSTIRGRYVGGRVEVARVCLADVGETMATLVHEVAHQLGGDGDARHTDGIDALWTSIASAHLSGRVAS